MGALMAIECSVPYEFKKIEAGLKNNHYLKDVFVHDSGMVDKKQAAKNLQYISHHVIHDRYDHAPNLYLALDKDCEDMNIDDGLSIEAREHAMGEGMQAVLQARAILYDNMYEYYVGQVLNQNLDM